MVNPVPSQPFVGLTKMAAGIQGLGGAWRGSKLGTLSKLCHFGCWFFPVALITAWYGANSQPLRALASVLAQGSYRSIALQSPKGVFVDPFFPVQHLIT